MTDIKIKPLKIGRLQLINNLIMAPMAGITDLPFRMIAKEGGAGLVCTEMVSANALTHKDNRTIRMMKLDPAEHPVSIQIFGSKPEAMAESAKLVEDSGADVVDINFGCPARKVVRSGSGSKILENEALLSSIMEMVVKAVKTPVTVKIRIGRVEGENVAPLIVKRAYECGVSAVAIHARTADLHHTGKPNLEAVKQAVDGAKIPVIGNGGIDDEFSAKEFFEATGCDGLMIGRGAIEDPEIFKRIEYYMANGTCLEKPSWEKRTGYLKKHAKLAADYYGEKIGLILLRKIAPYYLKGLPNASRIRDGFNKIEKMSQLDELLSQVWKSSYFGD